VCIALATALASVLPSVAPAGEEAAPRFRLKPAVDVMKNQVFVRFWVDRATDVAVTIVDEHGRTIRHLAAGLLGPNAPEPLIRGSLRQLLVWDGRDDDGRCAPPGRYRAEVKLGLTVKPDEALRIEHRRFGSVHGLAVGPKRQLYVMGEAGRDSRDGVFRVFDADGAYLRTILPRRGDLPLDRAKPLGEMVLDGGERFPTALFPHYGGRVFQQPAVTPDGDLIFVNSSSASAHPETRRFRSLLFHQSIERRLLRMAADGGAPKAGPIGPVLPRMRKGLLYLALGPDGRVYVSGARHAVFRVKWDPRAVPEPFAGTPDKPGKGDALRSPCGIAFDAKGNLYVADRSNHRIAVFDPNGKRIAAIPVQWPRVVAVHPKTGAVYVTSGYREQELVRFAGLNARKPTATYPLRASWPFIALDSEAKPAVIYAANANGGPPDTKRPTRVLIRLVDRGTKFERDRVLSEDGRPLQPLLYGTDRDRDVVYGRTTIFGDYFQMTRTGSMETFNSQMAPKANGVSEFTARAVGGVAVHVTRELGRLDHNLRPWPFSATGTYIVKTPNEDCLRSYYGKDVTIAPNGDIYWIHERGGYGQPMRCSAIYADGSLKKDSLIVFEEKSAAGVRVGRDGSVYVVTHLKPMGRPVPSAFADKVPIHKRTQQVLHYGSLIKFQPDGGRVRHHGKENWKRPLEPGEVRLMAGTGSNRFVVEGSDWSYYGVSMIHSQWEAGGCKCWNVRFDLDDFDRVFVPDQLRNRIVVLDANGNEITTFGRYGNVDEAAAGGLALGNPRSVMVGRGEAYIGDVTNQCVVRVTLDCATAASTTAFDFRGRTLADVADELAEQGRIKERREVLRLLNAEVRVRDLRREALRSAPSLRAFDWDSLVLKVAMQSSTALANADDARSVLAVNVLREAPLVPQEEIADLLGGFYENGSPLLRASVCWGLWGGAGGAAGQAILDRAIQDPDPLVRVVAAYVLIERRDAKGMAELLRGLTSKKPAVFKMAETAFLKHVQGKDWTMDRNAVAALDELLAKTRNSKALWYLRKAAILMLRKTADVEGSRTALLTELRKNERLTGNNLNRVVAGLGLLRSIESTPDLVKLLARGKRPNWRGGHADRAEQEAATALGRIGSAVTMFSNTSRIGPTTS
jgi:hypothetical protein